MLVNIQGVHFDVPDDIKEFIDKKLQKIDFAKDKIIELEITITQEPKEYIIEVHVHFQWGKSGHIKVHEHNLRSGIDKLIAKLKEKVTKEKEIIQEH